VLCSVKGTIGKLPAIPIGDDVTCRDFVDFLSEYFSGELAAAECAEFDAHLAECPTCVVYLDSYRKTIQLIRMARDHPEERVPDEVPEELVKAILAARAKGG
jgi:anti-sigma factor RsiW